MALLMPYETRPYEISAAQLRSSETATEPSWLPNFLASRVKKQK